MQKFSHPPENKVISSQIILMHQVTVKQFQPILVLSITISPVLSFDVKAMLLVRILP